jgi:hypothetical protein
MIATVCLLTTASGCTWLMGESTRKSRTMDAGFIVTGIIATPAVYCFASGGNTGEDGCFAPVAGGVLLGLPVLLGFTIAAELMDDGTETQKPATSGELPAIRTDTDTLQLAHEVQTQVRSHQCVAARVTMNRIAERDAEYHIAMLAKGVLGTCASDGTATVDATVSAPSMTPPTEPLPDVPTDATTLQLAKQVRTAAAAGQCASVERTMAAIAERDASYYAALAKSAVVARCR